MRTLFFLAGICSMAGGALAQCMGVIPAQASVVDISSTDPVSANGLHFWICEGGAIQVVGDNNTVYSEQFGAVYLVGSNNTVYSNGLVSSFNEGAGNTFFMSDQSLLILSGPADVTVECGEVTFDLSQAPEDGCEKISSIAVTRPAIELEIAPNPMADHLNIFVDDQTRIDEVRINDQAGRLVLMEAGRTNMKIDVSGLGKGLYIAVVETDRGTVMRKVRKE